MKLYLATMESHKFTFEVVAKSPRQALALLYKALRQHGRDYFIGINWWKDYKEDCNVQAFFINEAYRDGLGQSRIHLGA